MFNVTVNKTNTATGKPVVIAKGLGRQRTVTYDHAKSIEANMGDALGTLLNVVCDDRQRSMLRHPSGGQRVRQAYLTPGGSKRRFSVNV